MKFIDLLSGFGSRWPEELVNTAWPPPADVTGLLAQIDEAIELHDVAADIGADGTLTLTATLKIATGSAPADTRLVSRLFPSMQFVFRPALDWSSDFRCSIAPDSTVTVQIDTITLDVLVPPDLLAAHPDEEQRGADTKIALSVSADPTVITRDFALTYEADGSLRLEPHLPISVGPCTLMGVPCSAVHDIVLIGAPARADKIYEWVVRPLRGSSWGSSPAPRDRRRGHRLAGGSRGTGSRRPAAHAVPGQPRHAAQWLHGSRGRCTLRRE